MTPPATRQSRAEPLFLDIHGRRLFVLQILPTGPCRGSVLYLPPFAEEMNRCRSHVAATARALAAAGYRCLLLDPFGTGESEGDTEAADFDLWVQDAVAVAQWVLAQQPQPLTLWGLRTGALMAAEVAEALPDTAVNRLLFWQPVTDGASFVNQYLRLRLASQVVHGAERETTETMRQRLAAGEALEVSGYLLSGAMVDTLSRRSMAAVAGLSRHAITWIEALAKPDLPSPPATRKLIEALQSRGGRVLLESVTCPPVWQIHGREEAPALREATVRLLTPEGI